ncbi:hypothetical protein K440DRAFT_646189 [Wilcoxina mikolae CBS 423.85]|nr:hypothetical protein K440DRAFT_646189 [Wilcoxina mikolae CBS 423.85]
MPGSIDERIGEVLQFMKTCGFTSVSSFLVAMCDFLGHDIKHLTGNNIWLSLRTELYCIGNPRKLGRPASDLAEVEWESQGFGSIGEVFQLAAPATTDLVEQLGGVTALTADCTARSRGHYTGGSAVGDVEDHWGLHSPAPLEKRKMISVVAMSLLGYTNSQRSNILQNIQHNNTVGAVVFLKTQQGDPWPKRLPRDKQTVSRAEQLSNLLDAHSGHQSRPYTLAPEQWWIQLEEIGDFTTHDVLAPLFESVRTNMPRNSEAMICDTLLRFAGAEMGSKDGRSGQE